MYDQTGADSSTETGGWHRPRELAGATVVLCGTGTHKKLPNIPAVTTTLADLAGALTNRCGAPPPTVVSDPKTFSELGTAISKAARNAGDVLIIYYVGHGLVHPDGDLYLSATHTDSDTDELELTALAYSAVRRYVNNSPAKVKIVILDCCYSGIAVGTLGPEEDFENRAVIEGTYVITSAARDEAAIAPPNSRHTAFSGALIHLLEAGDPDGERNITLSSAYDYLARVLYASSYPRPRQKIIGAAHEFVLARNSAYQSGDRHPPTLLPPPRRRVRVPIVLSTVLAGIAAVLLLLSLRYGGSWRPPSAGVRGDVLRTWWGLLLLTASAVLVTLVIAGPTAHWITRVSGRSWWRPLRLPLLGIMAFGLAALLGGTALTTGASARVWLAGCPTTAIVSVLAPVDSVEPARELARAFERDTAADNFGCPVVRLLVSSATSDQINTALVRGWDDEQHVQIGPVPDVWLPDWSGEVRQAMADATVAGRTLPIAEARTVASTPLVLAVARSDNADLTDGTTWPGLMKALLDHGWGEVAPDPETSVGALARIPLYYPTNGKPPLVKAIERYLDQSFDWGRFALGSDAAALLCAPGGVRGRTGYVVTEQDVARFNHGDSLGPSCPQRSPDRLRAVYAADTPILDRQAVRFAWPQPREDRARAATRFTDWLAGPEGQQALAATGLRPPDPVTLAPLSPEWGVQPDLRPRPAVTSADLVKDVGVRYKQAHRYGRVLIAIDASGSMGLVAPGGSLWQVAARGASQAWNLAGARDELGVWAFQGTSVRKLVPPGHRGPAATTAALARIRPSGPAPLFSAIVGAVATAGPSTEDRVTAVVLLTDGENDNASVLNASQFRAAVDGKGVRVFAIAMGATGCAAPVLKTITTATAGKCLEADPGTVAEPMRTIFEAVL